jgi:nicotinamidase/pyrazinamidase
MANQKTVWSIGARDLLLVVDVQNDFCPGGALAVPEGDAVIAPILRVAPLFQHVVLTQDWHPADHSSFAAMHAGRKPYEVLELEYGPQVLWPVHCVMGSSGAEFHAKLTLQASYVQRKGSDARVDSYSAFFENDRRTPTGLEPVLCARGIERIFLAGLAYDFCVGYSALDARRRGFEAIVLQDGCRAIDLNGSRERMEENFAQAGVCVAQTGDLTAPLQ